MKCLVLVQKGKKLGLLCEILSKHWHLCLLEIIPTNLLDKLYLNKDDTRLSFIKSINIDSGPQGFPLTTLYWSNNYNTDKAKRFDWIVLKDENEISYYAQLLALLMVEIKDEQPTYLYVAVKSKKVEKIKNAKSIGGIQQIRNIFIPFDIISYDHSKYGD